MQFSTNPNITENITAKDKPTTRMFGWMQAINTLFNKGQTVTIPLAKLTGGGANGSITLTNGVLTSFVAPT